MTVFLFFRTVCSLVTVSVSRKYGRVLPDAHKRIGIVSSNPGKPDSDDSSSEGGSEDGDPQTLDRELRRLYEGEGKSM